MVNVVHNVDQIVMYTYKPLTQYSQYIIAITCMDCISSLKAGNVNRAAERST